MELCIISTAGLRPVRVLPPCAELDPDNRRVHFPGAISSKFTTILSFEHPATHPAMPTYRVMDSDGIVVDQSWKPSDIRNEEVVTWYKNMVTGMGSHFRSNSRGASC